jgi:hypothetical protein
MFAKLVGLPSLRSQMKNTHIFRVEYRQILSDGGEVLAWEFAEADTEIKAVEQILRRRQTGSVQIKIESCRSI